MPIKMIEQDLIDAKPIADAIIATVTAGNTRPPCAVAACAIGLAGVAVLAECGEETAINLFKHFYRELERRSRTS